MAVIENRVTEEGDVLVIKPEVPIVGILALYQFVDTTQNESLTDYFRKEFRYSVNGGLTFSNWEELTLINIQNAVITRYDAFVIEYRYTRVGNTPEVELSFNDILVSGEINPLSYPIFDRTIFKKFFQINDIEIYWWAINVLEKLYTKGLILPDYIERANNQSNLEDEDFIVFWNSITHIYAIIVYFARQFHKFETNQILLEEFLSSKDLTQPIDGNIEDILYLFGNYVDEYKKRGTYRIIDRKGDGSGIDGELIRITGSQIYEEFIFGLFQNFETGWCVGKSSPTWKGTENTLNLIRPQIDDAENKVSPLQAYEISFKVKSSSTSSVIDFGVYCYTKDDVEVSPKHSFTNVDTNYFFQGVQLKVDNEEYLIRGVLYDYLPDNSNVHVTNIGEGNNLRMLPNISKIVAFVNIDGEPAGELIEDFIIRPAKLPFSIGQLGVKNILYLNCYNNNGDKTNEQIKQFISEKLIPYDNVLVANLL